MLIVLRSDFRLPAREAFMGLMRNTSFKAENIFEVPILEAPQANAIILRLRKMEPERESVLVIGSAKDETLRDTLLILDTVRKNIPFLSIFPTILLARKSEWKHYEQVTCEEPATECFNVSDVLVLEQRDTYGDATHLRMLDHLLPKLPTKNGSRRRDAEETREFIIGDQPTATMSRITDEHLREAGIRGSIEPIPEDRITELPPPPETVIKK